MDVFYKKVSNRKEQHKVSREIIEYAANIYKIKNPELETVNKKPRFKYSEMCFSISHSDNVAAVCFDENPVGFDIEKIAPRDFEAISKRMKFKVTDNTLEEFYKNWTLYEAAIKLQDKVQSYKSQVFLDDFMMTIASNKNQDFDIYLFEIT